MLISNWLSALVSRIRRRPRYNSRARRDIRKRWQAVQQNRLTTVDRLEDRTLLTAQIIDGTAAADDFQLQMNADGVTLEVWNDTTLMFSDLLTNVTELSINGGAGADTFTVDLSNGLPFPTGNINFDGETDGGSILLDTAGYAGSLTTVTHTLNSDTAGSISIDGQIINYTNTASLTDDLATTNRVFDFAGAAETVTLSDHGTTNDGYSSIDSTLGAAVTFANTSSMVTVLSNAGSGADTINVQGLDSLNASSLTITGDTDDDVTFQTNNIQMGVNDLTVNAQTITVDSVVSSTDGVISLNASRNILLNTGSSLTTVDGGITLVANTGGTTTGDFIGIDANNATIQSTGSGNISLTGVGGSTDSDYGIHLNSSHLLSTSTNVNAGTITLNGTGGTGTASNLGIFLNTSSIISSVYGNIQLTGQGTNGTGAGNVGVMVFNGSEINSTGTGINAATISIDGTGGASNFLGHGVLFKSSGVPESAKVTSIDGNILITGQATNGAGASHYGVELTDAIVSSSGIGANAATITINGTGGNATGERNYGVNLWATTLTHDLITSVDGNIMVTGQGGAGTGGNHFGVVTTNGKISSTGTGADAASITINGDGGTGGATNYGTFLFGTDINSDSGDITILVEDDGVLGGNRSINSSSGDVTVTADNSVGNNGGILFIYDGAWIDAGTGDIDLNADGDVHITSLISSGTVTVDSTSGSILDNGDERSEIFATTAILNALNSVGTVGNPLEANVVNLSGNGTNGGFHVNNSVYKRIIDDGDAGFTISAGDWIYLPHNIYHGDDTYYLPQGTYTGTTASWEFSTLPAGTYRISGQWYADFDRATNTQVTVSGIVGGDDIQTINQRVLTANVTDAGFDWQDLGYYTVDVNGTITVTMENETPDGFVIADAMRIEKVDSKLTVSDINVNENAGTATFTVTSSLATGAAFSVDYATANGTAIAGSDYTATSGTLNFIGTAGETQTITVNLNNDNTVELDENFFVNLSNVQSSGLLNIVLEDSQASGTITNDDTTVMSLTNVSVAELEGDSGTTTFTFVVNLTNPLDQDFHFWSRALDDTATEVDGDFTDPHIGNWLTIAAGATSATIQFSTNGDTKIEDHEFFNYAFPKSNFYSDIGTLTPLAAAYLDNISFAGADQSTLWATGVILNDDFVKIIDDGDTGFSVSPSGWTYHPVPGPYYYGEDSYYMSPGANPGVTASWEFSDLPAGTYRISGFWQTDPNRATNTEFTVSGIEGGSVTQIVNQQNRTADVNDAGVDWQDLGFFTVDANGTITVTVANDNADGYVMADAMRIEKADSVLSVSDVSVNEDAGTATFSVTSSLAVGSAFSIDFATADGTAIAGSDYTATTGTLNFAGNVAGETQTITVILNNDNTVELDENFFVNLSNLQASSLLNIVLQDTQVTGTITNDDTTVMSLANANVSQLEGDSGTTEFSFVINISNPLDVDFHFWSRGYDDTATEADGDFSNPHLGSWSTITAGATSTTVHFSVNGDTNIEDNETFTYPFLHYFYSAISPLTDLPEDYSNNIIFEGGGTTLLATGTIINDDFVKIIDDGDAGFSVSPSGWTYLSHNIYYGDDTYYMSAGANPGVTASWQFSDLPAGTYRISGQWYADASRATNTDVTVSGIEGGSVSQTINQQTLTADVNDSGFDWQDLGFFTVDSNGTITVTMSNAFADGYVIADAMRLEKAAVLSVSDITVDEAAGTATLSVTSSRAVGNAFSVDFATANGTAVAGTDYTATSGTLNFTGTVAGETQTITVNLTNDAVVEADETLLINLSNLITGGQAVTLAQTQATATITDNDSATLSIADVTVDENTGTATFTVTLDQAVQGGVIVDWATADGTANAVSDYVAGSGTLNFTGTAGETQTITVTINEDNIVELDETFLVNLTNLVAGGNVTLAQNQVTATISDNDSATISIDDISVDEGAGTATFTVSLDQAVQGGVTVDWTTADGTANAVSDYLAGSGTLNFTGTVGETQTIIVTINDDSIIELDETFTINISNVTADGNVSLGQAQATTTIIDNDGTDLSIADVLVDESAGTVTLSVTSSKAIGSSFSIDFATADGTAVAGSDYTTNSGTLNFAGNVDGETQTITINLNNDVVVENNETFLVNLTNLVAAGNVTLTQAQATVTITDNDSATLSIADLTLNENAGTATFTVTLDQAVQGGVTVDWATADGTANAVSDYLAGSGTLNFTGTAGETKTITITINEDNIVELDETFLVNLTNLVAGGNVTLVQTQATTTITDNDSATLSIADLTLNENAGTATFTVTLDQNVQGGVTVDWATADGTANAVSDYLAGSGTLNFTGTAGETQTITVTINEDNIVELDETFLVNLTNLVAGGNVTLAQTQAAATITDNDSATLSIADLTLNENAGTATFTVTLDQAVQGGVTVDWATADGTANAVSDYLAGSGTLNFTGTAGETQTITVTINEDNIVELDETFLVNLTNLVAGGNVTLAQTQAAATITDNDSATLSIADLTLNENAGTATFTVTLDQAVQGGVTVDWATADGTANAVSDYLAGSGTLNFTGTAGETQTITVTINEDNIVELDETFLVNLTNLVAGGNVTLVQTQATTTITDNDSATLSIADLTLNENAGTATFNVTLDQNVQGGVTVDWATADGTANAVSDYLAGSGTLNFTGTAGETQTITVTINEDNIVELDETFLVNLTNLVAGGNVTLVQIQAAATITDNEPAANVSIADVTATEDGLFNFEISLDRVSDQDITVVLNTAYGTADSADFTAIVNQTVTITAGTTSVLVPVTVNNELLIEADETFTAVITDPKFNGISDLTKVTLADDTAVGTIQNDDVATITISDATIDEDAGTATFYVSVSHQIGQVFSIDYETVDGSATVSDGDYLANSGTLVFFGNAATPMGVETLAITILINNDQKSETSENFYINLSGLSLTNTNLVLGDSQGQATINDDDSASFSINDVIVNEADGMAVLTVSLDKDIDSGVSVDWSTANDTAVQGTDYTSASGTLNFAGTAGETQTITITLPQDTDIESTEQFFINLSNVQSTGQTVNIADNQGIVTITDDDSASVSINDITVNEADGTAVFTVTLTGQVGETVTVDWSTADNTADEISDYEASSGTLTFAGNTGETQTITVNLQTDGFIEAVESFYVNLTNATSANKAIAISDAQGEATISANAEEFSINDIITQEGDGTGTKTMTFTVTRNGADLTQQATIDFRTLTDPATLGGGDFVEISTPITLTFAAAAPGVTTQTQTVTVTINKDDAVEADEEFTVQIENASSGTIVKSQGIGTIANDDQASLTLTGHEVSPGVTSLIYREDAFYAYVIVTLDKEISGGLTVEWTTEDIDALAGIDYTAATGTLTFAGNAGETQTITIDLLNDNYIEPQDTFAVSFSNLTVNNTGLQNNVSLSNDRAIVEIFNEDLADNLGTNLPNIIVTPTSGVEGLNNSVKFNVVLDAAMTGVPGATFSYTTVDGTATAADNDYTPQTGTITFLGNANETHEVWITINDNSIAELTETFYLELTQTSGVSLPIDLSTAYAIIYDNDTAAVTASVSDITINEDDEVATFTVSLSQATIVDLSMLVNTGDPGDTAGVTDYFNLTDYQITIPAGQTSVTIDVPLYRDLLVEEDETFTLTLSDLKANGGTATGWATFSDATAVATITDTETTGLSISDAVVDENAATATFTVSLGTVASEDITFNASTVDGTATGGADFTAFTNQPYTITAGQSSIDITVNITNDSLFELNETFSLVLSNILVGGVVDDRLTILKGTGVGTINDDEAANITIADLTVNEAAGNAVLTVTVDQAVGYAFTVDWATQGETAYGASDYTTSSGTLNFTGLTANETQQITIPILDDDIVEWDETFLVNLSNVSAGGANVTLADDQAQVTISGNNDIATLSIGDLTALEHNQFGFEITLDKAATKDITVLASTADGTADSFDYTPLTDYLVTIAAGETSAFVYVTVNDDDLVEGSETFTISLSSPLIDGASDPTRVAVGAGALGTATGTISNNDFSDPSTTANAVDDYYFIKVEDLGTTVELNVLANDTKTGTTTITSITSASGGGAASVGQTAGDDVIVFTPGDFASGTITLNYTFEDSALNTGTGQVTIVIIDAYGITGDFKNDRYLPGIETPALGKVPEYISQTGFIADYLTKFENPSLVDDVDTVDVLDTVVYQNALGTGGSFSVTTDIDSTLTKNYTDLGGGSWTYSEDLVSTYTITTSFSESIGVSEFNTLTLVQSGTHNYQYDLTHTVPGTGNATTTWTLSEDASDHYDIDVDITVEEPGEDEYTTVETVTTLDKTFNYGNQSYTLTASETREDDGQGGDILIAEAHDITLFQKDEYKETIVATATVAQDAVQLGTSIITVNTDGATEWTRTSDRDYDYDAVNDEYTNSEGFSYSSLGHDNYLSVESTNILGIITETEDITVSEETTDENGTVIPAVVLSTTITTDSNIDIDTTDSTHDEFTFNYTGNKDFDNLGTNTLDTELTTYSYSDSGYSDYSTDEYSIIEIHSVNTLTDQRFYTLEDIVENSHSEYATTTSNTSRSGNTSGSAHSESSSSGWSNYDIYTQNIIDVTDESVTDIIDDYTLTETIDNYGSDTYRDFEVLDEQIVSSNLEGTTSYISASNGVDHHSLTSTTTTSTVNTQFPGSVLTVTSLIESTDQGTTNWGSSYSDKGNYQEYDYITPISSPGLIRHSYNLENYASISSGNRVTTLHTRDTSAYSEGATLSISSSNDFNETNRSYNFVDSSSGFSEYTTDEESLDATGAQRKSTFTINEEDQASHTETNGSSAYIIDNDSSQFVDNAINGITTQHTGLDTYDETGSKTWNVNEGEITISTRTDISTTTDGGENWSNDEVNSTSETTSHDWTEFNESGSSSFTIHSELDKTTIDQSVPGIKNTVIISNQYDESSGTITSEEGATPLSNNSFNKSLRTDNYLYADGTTSNVINSKSYESSASTYSLSDSSSFELINTTNPAVTSEQRGNFAHTRTDGERTSQVTSSEFSTTTGTPLAEGTPDSATNDPLVSVYNLGEVRYVKVGKITNEELQTDRSNYTLGETSSLIDITVQHSAQTTPDSQSLITQLVNRAGFTGTSDGIAPHATSGGYGGSGNSYTFGDGLNIPPGTTSPMGGSFYRISTSDSNSNDAGSEFQKSKETLNINFLGESGVELASLAEVTEINELSEHILSYNTFETSRATPVPDSGSGSTALPLPSFQSARSEYTEFISQEPGAVHSTTNFLSFSSSEDTSGNVSQETINRITASTNLAWELKEYLEDGAGNNGTNSRLLSNGKSTYSGIHEEVITNVTDPNQTGQFLTTTVVTDNFVTHAEDYSNNDIRYGGSNQLDSGWTIDLRFLQIGEHIVDTEVDVVITTDIHGVTTETGRRHTFRDNLKDHSSYALEVEGNFGGGSGLSGNFTVSADGGSTSKSTEDITMIDGTITDRAITELLTTGNGYHFQMSADGNGFEIVTSAGGGNSLEQNKRGNLDYEVIDGTRMNDSGYYSRIQLDGFGDTTSSGGSGDKTLYRTTRYFGLNGSTSDFLLNQHTTTRQSTKDRHDGRTGTGYHEEQYSTTRVVNSNQQDGPGKTTITSGGFIFYDIDQNGNPTGVHESDNEVDPPYDWLVNDADLFAEFQATLPFFDPLAVVSTMMNYVGGGIWDFSGLGFLDNGATQTAPNPTGDPVASGTEPDGTYWEHYDNGVYWLYREYASQGGELVKEEWGYHTQSFYDLLQGFNQLIEDANENVIIDKIDEFFADLTEVGNSLSQTNNVPDKAEQTIEDIAEQQEEHLPIPYIYPQSRRFDIFNPDAPGNGPVRGKIQSAKELRDALVDKQIDLYFGEASELKKKIAALEANRTTTTPIGFGAATIDTTGPKTAEQLELEKQLERVLAEAAFIRKLTETRDPQETIGPYAGFSLPEKFQKVLETAWEQGFFGDKLNEDLEALQDPEVLNEIGETLAIFGAAYAVAHYLPVTWAVDGLLIAVTAGEAGQVLADLYEAYLEVQNVTHESELAPAAKKLAELLVAASESGALAILLHGSRKVLPDSAKNGDLKNDLVNLTKTGFKQTLSKSERLKLFYKKLDEKPGAKNAEEALELIGKTLDEVEDAYSGVVKSKNPSLKYDGRMYPPQEDFIRRLADGSIKIRTRGNRIDILPDGTFIIKDLNGNILITKPGV